MWLAVPWLGFALLSILCHGTCFVFSPLLSSLSLQCYDGRLVCAKSEMNVEVTKTSCVIDKLDCHHAWPLSKEWIPIWARLSEIKV